ncbi:TetR family transcriptional regulator [Pseudomonas entomophila]|uniref:TetR/AcrR family transcriptional regulator n=1 Tax=Pseudomonas entomophila TaxID=312306 RepID=UPI0023D81AB1|nr:TetR/AcrR family transcriptional regulator [Pseudomonas entomophila]MDF0732072.1 TetR family transcriptional regulator [Pseudomonas entomophila]
MSRPRGRPSQGQGLTLAEILAAAFSLLEAGGERGLTLRSLAARLGVTPMSLYHHVENRAALLRAMAEQVYAQVLEAPACAQAPRAQVRALLERYFEAVTCHPQLTLALFGEPQAFAGAPQRITERLTTLLAALTDEAALWRDILVDHAHGCGIAVAMCACHGEAHDVVAMQAQYPRALERLLAQAPGARLTG